MVNFLRLTGWVVVGIGLSATRWPILNGRLSRWQELVAFLGAAIVAVAALWLLGSTQNNEDLVSTVGKCIHVPVMFLAVPVVSFLIDFMAIRPAVVSPMRLLLETVVIGPIWIVLWCCIEAFVFDWIRI